MVAGLTVSHETYIRLQKHSHLVAKWTGRINLIAPSTRERVWLRHSEDSVQLWPLRPSSAVHWIDLGSGGGFPGLVIAVLAEEFAPQMTTTLVEADSRKAAFLRYCSAELGIRCEIHQCRIEDYRGPSGDVISARALARLDRLLPLALPLAAENAVFLFPKGRRAVSELTLVRRDWHIEFEEIASCTDPEAVILKITEVERKS